MAPIVCLVWSSRSCAGLILESQHSRLVGLRLEIWGCAALASSGLHAAVKKLRSSTTREYEVKDKTRKPGKFKVLTLASKERACQRPVSLDDTGCAHQFLHVSRQSMPQSAGGHCQMALCTVAP